MSFVTQFYPMVALGETEGVAAFLSGAAYADEDVVRQVIPFGEALRVVDPVVSNHFLLDVKAASEAKDEASAQLPKRDIYELVKRDISSTQLKEAAGALRKSFFHPGIFRYSRKEILAAIRATLNIASDRIREIQRAIEDRKLYFGPHRAGEMVMLDIDQVGTLMDILLEEIEPLKSRVDQDAIFSLQNARNLAIVLADRAYEFGERDYEGGGTTPLTERLRALAILERWLDENAFRAPEVVTR